MPAPFTSFAWLPLLPNNKVLSLISIVEELIIVCDPSTIKFPIILTVPVLSPIAAGSIIISSGPSIAFLIINLSFIIRLPLISTSCLKKVFDKIFKLPSIESIFVNEASGTFKVFVKDTFFFTIKLPDISTSLLKETSSNLICLSKY